MSNTRKPKSSGLRAALSANTSRFEHFDYPLIDQETRDERVQALSAARQSVTMAAFSDDAEVKARAAQQVQDAKDALAECFRRITFRGLTLREMNALSNEHPDPEQPEGDAAPAGDEVEFIYHLAEACAVNGEDLVAADWKHYCDDVWSSAVAIQFRAAVMAANQRDFTHGIPKD